MSFAKLATVSAKRPWIAIILWVILLVISGFLINNYLNSALTTEQRVSVETESEKAEKLVAERLGKEEGVNELIVVKSQIYKVSDPQFRDFTTKLQQDLLGLGGEVVKTTVSYYQTQNPAFVSRNGQSALVIASLKEPVSEAEKNIDKVEEVLAQKKQNTDFRIVHSGPASINKDFQEIAESDLKQAEFLGIPIALVVLILVFGAIAAAFLPVLLAFLAIGVALAASAVFGQFSSLSFFVTNMITMMGLAVGIDYSLFVVSRFREERALGAEKIAAISKAGSTAAKAVFFSGITVVVALAGLLFVPSNIFRSLSLGAIFVVVAAVAATLTLLPAILSLLSDRINFLKLPFLKNDGKIREDGKGFWQRVSSLVMGHPQLSLQIASGFLILLAIPVLAIDIGSSGPESLPDSLETKEAFLILENEFSAGLLSPTQVVVNGEVGSSEIKNSIEDLERELSDSSFVDNVTLENHPEQKLAILNTVVNAEGSESSLAIEEIRSLSAVSELKDKGAEVLVAGSSASQEDFNKIIDFYTPIVFSFVLSLSFLFLMVVFRSLVVPLKAIVMNLLSVGAAYGILVLVFQKGFGAELLGFQVTGQIESWIPLFLFAVLFGLSMDYHVFLLSRIREKFLQTSNNSESVVFGLATTGRLITGAALIMVAVFLGFAAGELSMFEQVGFGLAVAIFLDATIVRSILVPASMKLLGDWNWYLPSWLKWLPKVGIEG